MPAQNAPIARTNGDLVADAIEAARAHLAAIAAWAAAHPDEAAAAAAPTLMALTATRRHPLTFAEAFVVAQLGYWGGVLALSAYRRWKALPANPAIPYLREVT